MATFPNYQPAYPATKRSEPKLLKVQFGDGYQQRISFGLNQNPKIWDVSFNLSDQDADIVEDFLNARAVDGESFDWVPPGTNTSYKWICTSWTREMFDLQRSMIRATFEEVFEL